MASRLLIVFTLCVPALFTPTNIGCASDDASGHCELCLPGFYLFSHSGTPLFENVPSFCVPDCSLHPMLRNNDVTGRCETCTVLNN